ncbi:succinate dehydrogenase, hydrophobic membrane anchor protein [Oleiagrimonas sp. C23AA]|uniref:succinate dehydrogenase, hydrophobic membrane anchor protein n=1 Tax=Oleiagrimonas sp. C23AA TaxID=2719047 RepID=UPI00142371A5|nr:succinate dehydrogenase, hydrophobic membrane anchor protein [Oleiagrimonas sp. C23AA]NII09092.1 succinate dehydrogenase, hydrophobic membrane anchor protein [Oleiagrimonas sp. C23AA]
MSERDTKDDDDKEEGKGHSGQESGASKETKQQGKDAKQSGQKDNDASSDKDGNQDKEASNKDDDSDHSSRKDAGNKDDDGSDGNDDDSGGSDDDDVIKVARTPTDPSLLSQLKHSQQFRHAKGLGSGRTGAAIWSVQRLTALALIPLAIWFAVSVVLLTHASHTDAVHWLASPVRAVLLALFIVIALRHAVIGLTIILEDYVRGYALRTACVLVLKGAALVIAAAVIAALIHLTFA